MIYKNASVTIKGHILMQEVEILKDAKFLKFNVIGDGVTVDLIISNNKEKEDLIRAILKNTKEHSTDKAWEFKCLLNVSGSDINDVKYTNYSLFVEDAKQIDEEIKIESTNKGLDLNKLVAEA